MCALLYVYEYVLSTNNCHSNKFSFCEQASTYMSKSCRHSSLTSKHSRALTYTSDTYVHIHHGGWVCNVNVPVYVFTQLLVPVYACELMSNDYARVAPTAQTIIGKLSSKILIYQIRGHFFLLINISRTV